MHSDAIVKHNDQQNNIERLQAIDNNYDEAGVLFLEWSVHLSGLLFIGEEFPKDRRLTKNAIVFGFAEGFYTSFCSVASDELLNHILPPRESLQISDPSMIRDSYCMNTLIRIQMIQYIIQATSARAQHVKNCLERKIENTKSKRDIISKIEKTKAYVDLLTTVITARRKKFADCKKRIEEIENKIFEHNTEMSSHMQIMKENINLLFEYRNVKLVEASSRLLKLRNALTYRRRMLAKELFEDIYTIHLFPDSRGYSICGIYLPDTNHFEDHDPKMISIALGYVTHLVVLISYILDIHLHYKVFL